DDRHAEQVFDNQVRRSIGEERDGERLDDALAEEFDAPDGQDDEAPEDCRMHETWPEVAADQTGLAQDEHDHVAKTRQRMVPPYGRLALEREPQEKAHPTREEPERDRDQRIEGEPAGNNAVPHMRGGHSARPPIEEPSGLIVREALMRVK